MPLGRRRTTSTPLRVEQSGQLHRHYRCVGDTLQSVSILHPSGTHGEALPEYRRQASAMDAIDAAIALLGQLVSSLQVAAQARRDYALSRAELSAVARQLPTRVDCQQEVGEKEI